MYLDKTTKKLKQCISTLRRNDSDFPVAVHFNDEKHGISILRFFGIEKVSLPLRRGDLDWLFKKREAYWTLHKLFTGGL